MKTITGAPNKIDACYSGTLCVCVCVCRSDACNLVPSQKDTVEISLEPLESEQFVGQNNGSKSVG
jgi:hypothetical protein